MVIDNGECRMNIPVGRILSVDTGDGCWGRVVYMVVNPPIVCEHCNTVVFEWRSSVGDVICPDCGNVIHDRFYYPCPTCGGDDYHTLRIVNNNNWHYDSTSGEVTEYNDKKGRVMNICGRLLMDDIRNQRLRLMTAKESQDIKRKIAWTGSDDYEAGKPIPDSIINQFPYSAQE